MTLSQTLNVLLANPSLSVAMIGIFALCIGSFLNVVIYRTPKMIDGDAINLNTPRSHCPHCRKTIPWSSNIPILSYIVLRGMSDCCSQRISVRYPLVEFATVLITLFCALQFGLSTQFIGASVFCWAMIALLVIDVEHQLLPDNITLTLLWAGLLFNMSHTFVTLESAVLGATIGYLFLWSIGWLFKWLRGIEGIGYGDYKLLAAIGAWLGIQALPQVVFIGSGVGVVYCIVMMLMKKQRYQDRIAFGPFLIGASLITLFSGILLW